MIKKCEKGKLPQHHPRTNIYQTYIRACGTQNHVQTIFTAATLSQSFVMNLNCTMMTSCPQNNVKTSSTVSHCHPSSPASLRYREPSQTIAPCTPRTFKTPVPRVRPSSSRLSTSRKGACEELDRFIPSRRRMNMELCRRKLSSASKPCDSSSIASSRQATASHARKLAYEKQLLSTLCSVPAGDLDVDLQLKSIFQFGSGSVGSPRMDDRRSQCRPVVAADPFAIDFLRSSKVCSTVRQSASNRTRVISCCPESVLDAPGVVDDFYTHPLSWSKDNVLAIAFGSTVYLYNDTTKAVTPLVDMKAASPFLNDHSSRVTVVKWCSIGGMTHYLAVGTDAGVRIYDTACGRQLQFLPMNGNRTSALCWNESRYWLTIGCGTGKITNYDSRSGCATDMSWRESALGSSVCNVAWNREGTCLASGRNDNAIHIWDDSMTGRARRGLGPRLILESHTAAVKGLAWCPYRQDILASGGGTSDRCIKLWNASSGHMTSSVDTGSQVSSLLWGQHHQELYSGHGYSDNTVVVWSYPKMERVETLSSHRDRILSMDMSPDGLRMASIGADETLCFWKLESASVRSRVDLFSSPSFGSRCVIR